MNWKRRINTTLEGITGYTVTRARRASERPAPRPKRPARTSTASCERAPGDAVRPPADPADRLLAAPVFLLSSVRSGSTLLRVMLNSHSRIHAPHELHMRRITVNLSTEPVRQAMRALGHTHSDVEHLLWDRLLHRELVRSGKSILVEKTPSNVFAYRRISTCWPDARFIFLLRHPLSIARSWHEADPVKRPMEEAIPHTLQYMRHLEEARSKLDGITLTYEDLTADPEGETRRICAWLGVDWEPEMIDYGAKEHGEFVKGIGDWRDKIRTGTVQPGRPLPRAEEVPPELVDICRAWGYIPGKAEHDGEKVNSG
ncbi:sulfotransferase family protein [Thermostaphylospora chromogena]|uniref:Sulfotransferase family protein n=1 Tax=Thermostaphylospora chromogena TaxID=35622 RepID=A0A1H1HP95_9ACTN|nr:sulfotransferase [Thermostaphylospora chromogena]SDR27179.1 Sulfotransferase family protein [Thermostaphylospora chromogena]